MLFIFLTKSYLFVSYEGRRCKQSRITHIPVSLFYSKVKWVNSAFTAFRLKLDEEERLVRISVNLYNQRTQGL